jgi:glucose/arabinose dehydrogenase
MKVTLFIGGLLINFFTADKPKAPLFILEEVFPNIKLYQPVEFANPDDGTNRIFVVEQRGIIHVFPNNADASQTQQFLNLTREVVSGGERGLLGLAFHPDFKNNGYLYVNYTRGKFLKTTISRFKVSKADPNKVDPDSELVLLTYKQPHPTHNGGKITFGKDGYLYISAGDGGSGGYPQNNSQNRKILLGKMIRIDVDRKSGSLHYAIPEDNPYKNNKEGFREEIYAYGLRNVWKFSFDAENGQLWAADVGQNVREEINMINNGGNYGWKVMEGMGCFTGRNREDTGENCNTAGLLKPVYDYLHSPKEGQCVIGGFVYRGKQMPALAGKYIFGDFVSGNIWALSQGEDSSYSAEQVAKLDGFLSAFGEDTDRELYVLSYDDGKILKLGIRQN